MQNVAYRLALVAGIGGLVLLTIAGSDENFQTVLGVVVLAVAALLVGLGKAIDLLGYVREGATETEEPQ